MNVQDILDRKGSSEVRTIAPDRTIAEAVAQLVEHNIGSLIVVEGERPVGIVTERDILRCCADDIGRAASTRVADVMTRDLIIGEAEDTVDYVMGIMTRNRIRHLPIFDQGRDILGMVSIGDVVESQLHETKYENHFHEMRILPGTWLKRLYPQVEVARINTIHHQAVKALGEGLVVEAMSEPDGIVVAIRWEGHSFVVGVQWHPEFMDPRDPGLIDSGPLLRAFLAACELRKKTGKATPVMAAKAA